MNLVVAGLLNKQVGGEVGISEITVKAPPRPGNAKDESGISRRVGENGGETPRQSSDGGSGDPSSLFTVNPRPGNSLIHDYRSKVSVDTIV